MTALKVDLRSNPYQVMLGVGGIGSGSFFALKGDHTLGREESRSGVYLDRRDYCKLHIISHYVKVLLGKAFPVLPIGRVGDDSVGTRLLEEMAAAGLDLRYVRQLPGEQTLFSFCFLYPDGSGGNLTTANSACDRLGEDDVRLAEVDFAAHDGHGIALAAPEAPLAARQELLCLGKRHGFLEAASFTSGEMAEVLQRGMLKQVDLLALNRDEAATLAGIPAPQEMDLVKPLVETCIERLQVLNPDLRFTITAGAQGSWSWDGQSLSHLKAFPTQVVGSAGAGDAFLAGVLAGLVCGLTLAQAQELGSLTAAKALTSPHTIDPQLDARSLRRFATQRHLQFSKAVGNILPNS